MAGRRQKEKTEMTGRMYGNSIQTTDNRQTDRKEQKAHDHRPGCAVRCLCGNPGESLAGRPVRLCGDLPEVRGGIRPGRAALPGGGAGSPGDTAGAARALRLCGGNYDVRCRRGLLVQLHRHFRRLHHRILAGQEVRQCFGEPDVPRGEVREMGHLGRREQVLYRGAVSWDGIALVP